MRAIRVHIGVKEPNQPRQNDQNKWGHYQRSVPRSKQPTITQRGEYGGCPKQTEVRSPHDPQVDRVEGDLGENACEESVNVALRVEKARDKPGSQPGNNKRRSNRQKRVRPIED